MALDSKMRKIHSTINIINRASPSNVQFFSSQLNYRDLLVISFFLKICLYLPHTKDTRIFNLPIYNFLKMVLGLQGLLSL